eukprot:CAMPEP_0174250230 /NCGR_PEP_ID=MMETSP0439-20130205/470_1 /TAXON_ID=0 /ORGANISM="Stereomyxa ramosa, Strain Chinc5" /LENGTH=137 /DNA_ID=CAMNT_0015330241 /DNA_START=53 /DNA_END=466 /DNA_ORIENTATION=+
MSLTLRSLLKDISASMNVDMDNNEIPLPTIHSSTLDLVIKYCREMDKYGATEEYKGDYSTNNISKWESDFVLPIDLPQLVALTLAANFLAIGPLLTLMKKTIANHIKGKTPDEIEKDFRIPKSAYDDGLFDDQLQIV